MFLYISVLTVLCLLRNMSGSPLITERELELEKTFRARTRADWERVWHSETHVRCRERLHDHLYWACEKDIYRLTRRDVRGAAGVPVTEFPFLPSEKARNLLKDRLSRRRRSITRECCLSSGCTWEEYAEYCVANRRVRKGSSLVLGGNL